MKVLMLGLAVVMMAEPAFARMSVHLDWGPTKSCFDPNSPPFAVSGVPKGTKTLKFHMTDLNVPSFRHGGGLVAYNKQSKIPYGAFHYKGPCPPRPHLYRFDVEALDGKGKVLAKAVAEKRFSK
jgi:hypothetical protein